MGIYEERRRAIMAAMEAGRGSEFVSHFPLSLEPPLVGVGPGNGREGYPVSQERATFIDNPRFIRIKPSIEDKNSLAEQLILSLPAHGPVAFEVIGSAGRINFQMVTEESRADVIVSQAGVHFPGADVYPGEDMVPGALPPHAFIRAYRLKTTHFLPLTLHADGDPYRTLFGCLGSAGHGQAGILQVLFAPVVHDWQSSMRLLARSGHDQSSPFVDLDLPRSMGKKVSKPLFAVSLRMAATDAFLLAGMEGFLKQFESEDNGIMPIIGPYPARSLIERNTFVQGFLLNSSELAYFFHLPAPELLDSVHGIERASKSYPVPVEYTTDGPVLGYNLHRGIKRPVCHSRHLANRHLYICGDSGGGKSNCLLNIIIQIIQHGDGLCVIDPHNSLSWEVLRRIPKERKDDAIFYDAADFDFPINFNPLSHTGTKLEQELIREDVIDICASLSDAPLGVNILYVLHFAIQTLLTRRDSILQNVEKLLLDNKWRAEILATIQDERILTFWETEFPLLQRRGISTSIMNKLTPILHSAIAPMLAQRENKIDFFRIINDRKILICNLPLGKFGKKNSNVLGRLLVSRLNISAMMREEGAPPFYLAIDEFQSMLSRSIADTLSGGRKFGLHILLANQMVGDIPDNIMRHVFNASTIISFSTSSPENQMTLEKVFSKKFTGADLTKLQKGEALVKMGAHSFTLKTERVPDAPALNWADEIIALSREKYAAKPEPSGNGAATTTEMPEKLQAKAEDVPPILAPNERAFLECAYNNPTLNIVALYKAAGLSGYMGDKVKTGLKAKGLISEVMTHLGNGGRRAKYVLLTSEGFDALGVAFGPDTGKGGPQHRYAQSSIKFFAESKGYKAVVEEPIPGGKETVDLGLEREGKRVAVEISITTKPEHEVGNVKKSLEAGYSKVLMLFLIEDKLAEFYTLCEQALTKEERQRVSAGLLSEFCRFLL